MNIPSTLVRAPAAALVALLTLAAFSAPALAQNGLGLTAACTDTDGALFRIDNAGEREVDFTLRRSGSDTAVSGSAYPIGRGGSFVYLPAGSTAELVVRGAVVASASANASACPSATVDTGRPICEGLRLDPASRQALFVGASEFRGVTRIVITVENGRVLVYDPHALFVVDAGGSPAPVFVVGGMGMGRTVATFDTGGDHFHAGYGLLLKGNPSGPVAFFATIHSPGGVVECDPQFTTSSEGSDAAPGVFALGQNLPNPFTATTSIPFTLDETGPVTLRVYDALGRQVVTLVEGEFAAGSHSATWNLTDATGRTVSSGTYLYRLEAGGRALTQRMTVLR